MIEQLRSKQSGDTVAQYVSYLHVDLEDIGIGLGMIVDTGRINYGLEGPQLIAIVRLALKEQGPPHLQGKEHHRRQIPPGDIAIGLQQISRLIDGFWKCRHDASRPKENPQGQSLRAPP